jgi:dipeptidyl-peptidase 4
MRPSFRVVFAALALLTFLAPLRAIDPAAAAATDANLAYFRDLAETRNYTLGRPVSPRLTPDGNHVVFLRSGSRSPVQRLFELDVTTGAEREIVTPAQLLAGAEEVLSAEEKARRERARVSTRGFTTFELSPDGATLLVTLSGQLYAVDRVSAKVTPLPGKDWIDPRFSPDGKFVAACANRELHLIELATHTARQLTHGATETISHGVAEFVAQEEMDRSQGYWWSPDSRFLAYQETDESGVEVRYIADPLHPESEPAKFFYPRAGTANAQVRLGVISRDGGETRWISWDRERYPYLARVTWKAKDAPMTLLVQNREQQEQVLLAVDPATGSTREILKESDSAWVELDRQSTLPQWLPGGKEFLWSSEQRGARQLEIRKNDGSLVRAITPLEFRYDTLLQVSPTFGYAYVRGSNDPREMHVWKFPLAEGNPESLTREAGTHSATFARDRHTYVHTYEFADGRSGAAVCDESGKVLREVRSEAETPAAWPVVEHLRTSTTPAFDASIVRPRAFDRARKYPVILSVYAGPGVKVVTATKRTYFPDQWLADQGYIVVRIDGRGTPLNGRDWARAIRGNFIDVPLNDQVEGLRALAARYPELDLTHTGVTGWSFGGYFSAMATIRRPDIFRCGVAGAPVVTWENYDTHYTERYLGLPEKNPDAYRISNVTTYADQLQRPLLLIHGLTDDNVYFQHTVQLAEALFRAGKPFELLPLLGTHMVSDPLIRYRQQMRIVEFFDRYLKSGDVDGR